MKSATETLARASQSLGAALYQSAQGAGGPGDVPGADAGAGATSGAAAGAAADSDDDVVDAEIVDDGEQK